MGTWHRPSEPFDASKVHEDIKYTEEDDKAIDDWIADHVETTWHSLGTCAMKPRAEGGVVDSKLNVYGTKNLKVCDVSSFIAGIRRHETEDTGSFPSRRRMWARTRIARR